MGDRSGESNFSSNFFVSAHPNCFTLSLLKDTGWYSSVNFNLDDELFVGKGKGCPFLE